MNKNKFNIGDKIYLYTFKTIYDGVVRSIKLNVNTGKYCYAVCSSAPFVYKDDIAEHHLAKSIPDLVQSLKEAAHRKYMKECLEIEDAATRYETTEKNRQDYLKYREKQEKKEQSKVKTV